MVRENGEIPLFDPLTQKFQFLYLEWPQQKAEKKTKKVKIRKTDE